MAAVQSGWLSAAAGGNAVALDPALGNLRLLRLAAGGRVLEPLHRAPWLDEPEVQADAGLLPVERALSGDFFCAPFGAADVEPAPAHGWSANSAWRPLDAPAGSLRLALERPVMGTRIEKRLRLAADAPLLYQEHLVAGGHGGLTVAHHPMVGLGGRGRLSHSPKRLALSPETPLEPGRHRLACPAETADLARFPAADGGAVDLGDLPIADAHEDFVTLVEAGDGALGWSALVRDAEDDVVFLLKDPRVLPVTMLWHSNGGRDYSPWNGRHRGVVGIEDGCAAGAGGHAAALGPNRVAAIGVATFLPLAEGRTHRVAHVIGAIPRPAGWHAVADVAIREGRIDLADVSGGRVSLPFDTGFLDGRA